MMAAAKAISTNSAASRGARRLFGRSWRLAAAIFALTCGRAVLAEPIDDALRQHAPESWIEPFVPERLAALSYRSYDNDLDKARLQVSYGRYKTALITLEKIKPRTPADAAEIALLRAGALEPLGRLDEALAALADPKLAEADPAIEARQVEILAAMDRRPEALTLLHAHLAKHPDSIEGRYQLGVICQAIGDIPAAKAAFGWFAEPPRDYLNRFLLHDRSGPFEHAEQLTLIGKALDRWATLSEQYRNNPQLDKNILNIFVQAYDRVDRRYWPAHVAAGEYFLTHDNPAEATKELLAALGKNPNDLHSIRLMGKIAIDNFSFEGAEQAIAALRAVNPHSVDADLLETRNLLLQRRPELAFEPVLRVLKAHPQNLEAMGLLAAAYGLQLKDAKTAQVLADVDKIDPTNATAYFEVAQQFSAVRQYPRSAAMFKKAIERAPWWTAARNGLGLLYTQSGDEDSARTVLNAARELDPFNISTTNYLKLLDMMDGFARKESAHFVVMYDPTLDPVIPEYFNDYLESVHKQICDTFKTEPKVKTYIEVFPTHDAFSVRTTGSPWIGTVGASTGRVIALVSPRNGQGTMGTFNWAQVLRHEYTHTVTLAATDNRIQHWMTEGLAVYEERTPMRWEWVPMLYNAVKKHELFPIDQLTWSFVRPKRPIDRQLAYAESYWICQYLEETYGHDTILKLLADFHDAEPQEVAFPKETHKSLSEFQADFFAWCDQTVSKWGYDAPTSQKYKEMAEKADALVDEHEYKKAVDVWEDIVLMRPVDEMPHKRLAGLYLTKAVNDPQRAADELVLLSKVELKDNRYAKRVARLYRDMGKLDDAAKYGLLAVYTSPYDLSAHELLSEIYTKAGNNPAGLERETRVLAELKKIEDAAPKP